MHEKLLEKDPLFLFQFVAKLAIEAGKIHFSKTETYLYLPVFVEKALLFTHFLLEKQKHPSLNHITQNLSNIVFSIKGYCQMYAHYQRLYVLLVNDKVDSDDKLVSMFNRHLYKYTWMLVIFAIG